VPTLCGRVVRRFRRQSRADLLRRSKWTGCSTTTAQGWFRRFIPKTRRLSKYGRDQEASTSSWSHLVWNAVVLRFNCRLDLFPQIRVPFATVGSEFDHLDDLKATRFASRRGVVAGRYDPLPGPGAAVFLVTTAGRGRCTSSQTSISTALKSSAVWKRSQHEIGDDLVCGRLGPPMGTSGDGEPQRSGGDS